MRTWIISWYSIVPRDEGKDTVVASDVGDARKRYTEKHPQRKVEGVKLATLEHAE